MVKPVGIGAQVLAEVASHAKDAFPAECCGWLEGKDGVAIRVRRCENAQGSEEHPTANERGAETAYVIAGADLLALNKAISANEPALVIYHSHPNGRAYFSETDHRVATDPWGDGPMYPVQQLVLGIDESGPKEAALFAWDDDATGFVEVWRTTL